MSQKRNRWNILFCIQSNASPALVRSWNAELQAAGFRVHTFELGYGPQARALTWPELDRAWRSGDRILLNLYAKLIAAMAECQVLVNGPGINLHPEFVRTLPWITAFGCCDDPENSHNLSMPAAAAYDFSVVANIAAVASYAGFGAPDAHFFPMGFFACHHDETLTAERIRSSPREIPVSLVCERVGPWRRSRLDQYSKAFPHGIYYGQGWPKGHIPEADYVPLLQKTLIGPNFHNSTGPINLRTYTLPANGVLQLCDNRSHLAKIFTPGVEVVGFDTVEEAIELTRYYLDHQDEAREIAVAGWQRTIKDYSQSARFDQLLGLIDLHAGKLSHRQTDDPIALIQKKKQASPFLGPASAAIASITARSAIATAWGKSRIKSILRRRRG